MDRLDLKTRFHDASEFSVPLALKIGLFQCLAMIPGTSRSGATIVGSMLMGVDKRAAAEFSFFLAIPTMLGAFTLDLVKNRHLLSATDVLVTVVIAAVIAYAGWRSISGGMQIGNLLAFMVALTLGGQSLRNLAGFQTVLGEGLAAAQRLFAVLDVKPTITDAADAKPLTSARGEIRIDDVHFAYGPGIPALGGVTILAFLAWEKWRPRQLRLVPGALVGVVAATLLAVILGPDVKRVVVPESRKTTIPSSTRPAATRPIAALPAAFSCARSTMAGSFGSKRAAPPWTMSSWRRSARSFRSRRMVSRETSKKPARSAMLTEPSAASRFRISSWRRGASARFLGGT